MGGTDTTIYAHWIINSYDLVVKPNSGEWDTHTANQTYNLDYDEEKNIVDPTKEGYSFTGWTLTGTGSTYDSSTKKFKMGYENASLEANYEINTYTLTIEYDNEDEDDEFELDYQETKTITEPTKEGYTFSGWDDGENDLSYLSGSTYTQPAHDVTLTATWTPNTYKWIVYHEKQSVDGSQYTLVDTEEGEDEFGETFSGTLKNYTGFANPALQEKTIRVENNYPPTTNVIDYEYDRNTYRLTIDANGGTYSGTNPEDIVYEDTRNISDPTKTCHTFNNWTLTGSGSTIQNRVFTMGSENATLTANWNMITYTITFDPNGGSIIDPSDASQTVNCGNAISLLTASDITRVGYQFNGWWTDASGGTQITAGTTPNSSQIIYAHWTPITYTITLDKQDGSGGTDYIYEVYDNGYYLNNDGTNEMTTSTNGITIPSRTSYNFEGYYTGTNGSGTQYIDASGNITNNALNNYFSDSGTLYAKWVPDTVTVNLENAKFSDNTTSKTLSSGTQVEITAVLPSDYTESSYTGNSACSTSSDVGNTYYQVHHSYSVSSWNVSNSTSQSIMYTVPSSDVTVTATISDTTSEVNKYECQSVGASYSNGYYYCNSGDTRSGSTCTKNLGAAKYTCPDGGTVSGSTCTKTSAASSCTYTKTSGYWSASYSCSNGTGTIQTCSYSTTTCNGGRAGRTSTFMCTYTGSANLCQNCNSAIGLSCSVGENSGYRNGGSMPSSESCSCPSTTTTYDATLTCSSGTLSSGYCYSTYNAYYSNGYYYCNNGTLDNEYCIVFNSVN